MRAYNPSAGRKEFFEAHLRTHTPSTRHFSTSLKVPQSAKNSVRRAAAVAVFLCLGRNQNTVFSSFRKLVYLQVREFHAGKTVNVEDLVPSAHAIKNSLIQLEFERLQNDRTTNIPNHLQIGGGMTHDGLHQCATGKKYFELALH